jgi:DNA-binding protein
MTEQQEKEVIKAIGRAITHIAHTYNVLNDEVLSLIEQHYVKTKEN